jgi:hypothetical protein
MIHNDATSSFVLGDLTLTDQILVEKVASEAEFGIHLPVLSGYDAGAKVLETTIFGVVGTTAPSDGVVTNLPAVTVTMETVQVPVVTEATTTELTYADMRAISLSERRRAAAGGPPITYERALQQGVVGILQDKHEQYALRGNTARGVYGLLNTTGLTTYATLNNGVGPSTRWKDKTPELIAKDLTNFWTAAVFGARQRRYRPDYIVMAHEMYQIAAFSKMEGSDLNVLEHFKKNCGSPVEFAYWDKLDGQGPGGTHRAFAYKKSPEVLAYRTTIVALSNAPVQTAVGWSTTHEMASAGVTFYRPHAVATMTGA